MSLADDVCWEDNHHLYNDMAVKRINALSQPIMIQIVTGRVWTFLHVHSYYSKL